ncbi:MAG: putative secreted protein [Dactylosporangium sp.]|nr:putative secreted protein [Dactylosporangium sp.]
MAVRGRRWLIALVVVVVVLVGLFVVADRVAVNMAEKRIADQAATEMRNRDIVSDKKPRASIAGFPFLTQVLGGTYQKVTINVDHPRNGRVTLDYLTLVANQVHAPLDTIRSGHGRVTADTVVGTAAIGWDVVRELVDTSPLRQVPGLDVSKLTITVKDNKMNLAAPVAFAGLNLQLQATGTLAVAKGEVHLQLDDLRTASATGGTTAIPPSFLNQYRDRLGVKIAVPNLPYSLVVNKVETTANGIMITATAANVVLAGQA